MSVDIIRRFAEGIFGKHVSRSSTGRNRINEAPENDCDGSVCANADATAYWIFNAIRKSVPDAGNDPPTHTHAK